MLVQTERSETEPETARQSERKARQTLELSDLRLLIIAARAGSLGRTAVELNMPQPNVTRRLHAIETTLGVQLFERHSRGVRPTEAGKRLLACAEAVLEQMRAAALAIDASPTALRDLTVPPPREMRRAREPRRQPMQGPNILAAFRRPANASLLTWGGF